MKLADCKLVFVAVGLIGVLLISAPVLGTLVRFPDGEAFSELYLLGPERMAENFPFNIATGQNFSVYVGAGNHMGSPAYYAIYVKFGGSGEPLPNATGGVPSPLEPLFEYRFVLEDGDTFERPLSFSVVDASFSENQSMVKTVEVKGVSFDVDAPVAWDAEQQGWYYRLLVELWIYNAQHHKIEFTDRFVYLQLNMTGNKSAA
ncbi:MAG: DUF1616 domain-containing protein [Candidatus Bathyarchaeota archaeon]|nr:DUF1616 domain-containing protein [Candidatus Bathyarchaeota archaeon]